jgi:hypothetical protein
MGELAGRFPQRMPRAWWLRALNVELLVAVAAFLTLVVGEVVYALEERRDEAHVHDHGIYGTLFDVAWVVFVPAFALALLGGVLALAGGALARNSAVSRYGTRAVAFCALALAVVALVELVGS